MMARRRRVLWSVVLLPIAAALCGFAPAARSKPRPTLPTPAYSPPPAEQSPFSGPDSFCAADENQFDGVRRTDPTLRAPAQIVWLVPPGDAASGGATAAVETFGRLTNACGGIGGRPVDVRVVHTSADPAADCASAAALHPVLVVSTVTPAAWSCLVRDQHTILVTGSEAANADLAGSSGRLAAVASAEGIERARLVGVVGSGRLDGRKVAIVAGDDPEGVAFRDEARRALALAQVKPVDVAQADTVLAPSIDLAALGRLVTDTAAARRGRPLDAYSFEDAAPSTLTEMQTQTPEVAKSLLHAANLYAFSRTSDPSYRASQSLNAFSGMCNRAVVDVRTARAGSTTTTVAPEPPIDASVLTTSDVCLLSRIVDRALFAAGPTLDQRALVAALHRLPLIDQAAPGGTPKPRPNQVINEPVRRIEQVVVLSQLQTSCPSGATTTTSAHADACWVPASGWDDGGQVVNTPLGREPAGVNH